MKKADFLKQRIENMRRTEVKERNGKTTTIGEIAQDEAKSLKVENSAIALITTVLAMRQKWNETARPRIEAFKVKYPHVKTLKDLKDLVDSMSEREFCKKILDFESHSRYARLKKLTKVFIAYQKDKGFNDDWEAVQDWAKRVDINNLEDSVRKIKGIGLATVQNLRLTCGIDTAKPDVHVKESLKEVRLGNEVEVVELISELTGYKCRELDQIFWYWHKNRSEKDEITEEEFKKL